MKNFIGHMVITSLFLCQTSISAKEKCEFDFDREKTILEWTAFKFTEKTGVKGTIEKFEVKNTKKSASILESLKDLRFTVKTESINSNNPDRDAKIRANFFGSVKNGAEFKGKFSKIESGSNGGTAMLDLEFNKFKYSIPVTFEIADQTIVLNGTIDVLKFGLGDGIQKLNEVCGDLHKGTDGKSKLWPTVDVKVTSTLLKGCH